MLIPSLFLFGGSEFETIILVTLQTSNRSTSSNQHQAKQKSDSRKAPKLELPENHGSTTSIIGAPDIYFQVQSLVNITCIVNSLQQPEHIFWYHNGEVISYYSTRGGISIVRKMGMDKTITMSSLIIREAGQEDQGTYTCRPLTGDFKTARTRLFIGYGGISGASVSKAGQVELRVMYFKTIGILCLLILLIFK